MLNTSSPPLNLRQTTASTRTINPPNLSPPQPTTPSRIRLHQLRQLVPRPTQPTQNINAAAPRLPHESALKSRNPGSPPYPDKAINHPSTTIPTYPQLYIPEVGPKRTTSPKGPPTTGPHAYLTETTVTGDATTTQPGALLKPQPANPSATSVPTCPSTPTAAEGLAVEDPHLITHAGPPPRDLSLHQTLGTNFLVHVNLPSSRGHPLLFRRRQPRRPLSTLLFPRLYLL